MATAAPTDTFTITASPGTDIWRKPPTTDVFNAPTAPPPGPPTIRTTGPLQSFLSARLSLSFTWKEQYDQGGILLSFRRRNDNPTSTAAADKSTSPPPPKWIKTGIEFYNGAPRLSTVACDAWADWSVADLGGPGARARASASGSSSKGWTTVAVEKEGDEHGTSLWVYRVLDGGEKVPLREVCWVFGGRPEEWEVEVAAMAARPAKGAGADLKVEFKGMEVRWA
ncbi:hypothetical protein VTK56DRAFT_4366 [Thermocarpiscus australiensis]